MSLRFAWLMSTIYSFENIHRSEKYTLRPTNYFCEYVFTLRKSLFSYRVVNFSFKLYRGEGSLFYRFPFTECYGSWKQTQRTPECVPWQILRNHLNHWRIMKVAGTPYFGGHQEEPRFRDRLSCLNISVITLNSSTTNAETLNWPHCSIALLFKFIIYSHNNNR
jgi:hypothetical protein